MNWAEDALPCTNENHVFFSLPCWPSVVMITHCVLEKNSLANSSGKHGTQFIKLLCVWLVVVNSFALLGGSTSIKFSVYHWWSFKLTPAPSNVLFSYSLLMQGLVYLSRFHLYNMGNPYVLVQVHRCISEYVYFSSLLIFHWQMCRWNMNNQLTNTSLTFIFCECKRFFKWLSFVVS